MAAVKPPIPVGTAKVVMEGRYGPATWANVYYIVIDAGASTPGEVIAAIADWFYKLYHDYFPNHNFPDNWSVTTCVATYRDAEDSLVRVRVADAVAGSGGAAGQDAQVAYLINWSTGDPRKGGKPRQYIPGVPDTKVADSAFLTSTVVNEVNTGLIAWLEEGPTRPIPMQLVEMSFRNGGTWRDAAHTYPIIGGTLNPVVATQRRRVDRLRPS